jgi:ectoine hydroxylase-related dioxygenase (phytanoyl-CoA dioxygenase family)
MTIADRPAAAAPAPTTDLDQARQDLASTGLCVLSDVLTGETLAAVRDALYRAADSDRRRGREVKFAGDYPDDNTNQRVWNLPSRDPVFLDLVEHPLALMFVREAIGWPALLSNISANITGPGGGEMFLHADQTYMPQPWSGIQGVNVIWCVDDFTEENGATRVVPGSHQLNRAPTAEDQVVGTVPLEAPAGAMVVMEGRVWHKTGNNRTPDHTRAGIFGWYTLPIYLPQENWWLSLDPSIRQFGSDDLLVLFGYRVTAFGKVNGASLQ